MTKTMYKFKRAVSPVIATVLLIALTVSAGAVVWVLFGNTTNTSPTIVIDSSLSFSDSGNDADILIDEVSFNIRNLGPGAASIDSVTVEQSTKYTWTVSQPISDVPAAGASRVTINSADTAEQLVEGSVKIELVYGDNSILQISGTVPSGNSVDQTLSPTSAIAYQDEGTIHSSDIAGLLTLIGSLDGNTAPSVPEGTVTIPYFANGGSNRYWDALELNFDATGYPQSTYSATLRIYIFDGGYSTTWHHYQVLIGQDNTTNQDVAPPAGSTPWDDNADNGPDALQIDITLKSFEWSAGSFWITFRIWDAKVDLVQLILTPNA